MKHVLFVVLLVVTFAPQSYAEVYQSAFGFTFDMPSHWRVVTQEEIQDNATWFEEFSRGSDFESVAPQRMQQTVDQITSGEVEIYLNEDTADDTFTDNVNVTQRSNRISDDPRYLKKLCPVMPSELSRAYGKLVGLYQCDARGLNGRTALYLEFDGAVQGTRSMQYQIKKSPTVTIVITATAKDTTLGQTRSDFDKMMQSVRF